MEKIRCLGCGRLFTPSPKVKNQKYCSEAACQRKRKLIWQKNKLAEDPDYKRSQLESQKRWRDSHPNYWRDYREKNSDYVRRNMELQRERNRARRAKLDSIAKMDALRSQRPITSGIYKLIPCDPPMIANMDSIKVEIQVIASG